MKRELQLVGQMSGETYVLHYPGSVLKFCGYDLTYFAENAIAACNDALRTGEPDFDRMTELRNSIAGAHVYIEHNIRTIYDKVVLDCWIDYVCRRDNVGTGSLWNRFIGCKTTFEKIVFTRLCDYRYHRAINEWLNLVREQDYAKNKVSFLFSKNVKSAEEAASRRNYFDLMFSVTARELGCRVEELGVTKVLSVGRLPSAPFMFPNLSKDIVKNLLADFDYSEDYSKLVDYGGQSDQIAMDAFSHMKQGLSGEYDSYNISDNKMDGMSGRMYMPCGLKAVIDLELDALIESGGWLAVCKKCGRYFLRDAEHKAEYCSIPTKGGKTCLEIYELENPKKYITEELEDECREITDLMYERVDKDMSLSEYESWKTYLDALREKVDKGELPPEELSKFIRYSKSMDLSRSKPLEPPKKPPEEHLGERVIRPFVPERVERSELPKAQKKPEPDPEELAAKREGFFTSPIVKNRKSERAPIAHIIRNGEQRGGGGDAVRIQPRIDPNLRSEVPNGFMAFGESYSKERGALSDTAKGAQRSGTAVLPENAASRGTERKDAFDMYGGNREESPRTPVRSGLVREEAPEMYGNYREEPLHTSVRSGLVREEAPEIYGGYREEPRRTSARSGAVREEDSENYGGYREELRRTSARSEAVREEEPENYGGYREEPRRTSARSGVVREEEPENYGGYHEEPRRTSARSEAVRKEEPETYGGYMDEKDATPVYDNETENSVYGAGGDNDPEIGKTPSVQARPRVIKKNAAAISAYGKIAGTAFGSRPPELERVLRPEEEHTEPDRDPFKDIGSIFDELTQADIPEKKTSEPAAAEQAPQPQIRGENPGSRDSKPSSPPVIVMPGSEEHRRSENTESRESKPVSPPPVIVRPGPEEHRRREKPKSSEDAPVITNTGVPSGIWTEDRHLYDENGDENSELAMLKEKKRSRTSKTQRLFDAIMREPEDNPNFRRK